MSELPFAIRALVGTGNIVSFIAERDGEQLAIVNYMVGTLKRRVGTADAWVKNEKLCGKQSAKKRAKMKQAIEAELESAELRARKALDERAEAEAQASKEAAEAAPIETRRGNEKLVLDPANYHATPVGIVWLKPTPNGAVEVRLTNFNASIVSDVVHDDGLETTRLLEIEAVLFGGTPRRFSVPVSRFPSMNWVVEELGPRALVYPGMSIKDHARAAIQTLSTDIANRRVYTHTGWRRIGDKWFYLHTGGAIGPDGPVTDIEVNLPESLSAFRLSAPMTDDHLRRAIRASLDILKLGPPRVVAPILAAVYRSVIDVSDFVISLYGHTGVFKTELAALAMQHLGAEFTARKLPASWSSTGNALEAVAFTMKDAILVIDDFAPGGSSVDIARYHKEADRVLRAQGNNSGRGRLRPDGMPRPTRHPRGLILTTGEEVPRGESLRARQLIIEIKQGDIIPPLLAEAQTAGTAGLYAGATAGFLQWMASRLDNLRAGLRDAVSQLRTESLGLPHRRMHDVVAHLAFGLRTFLNFAVDVGAINKTDAEQPYTSALGAMLEQAAEQREYLHAADPARRYLELIGAAIVAGEAHLNSPDGDCPKNPERWGWTAFENAGYDLKYRPSGDCIGWLDDNDVYLEPSAAYRVAQKMGGQNDGMAVSERTLRKRLAEGGCLATTDRDRGKVVVRRTLQGHRRDVLHLDAARIMLDESAQPAQQAHETGWNG